jgi:hypothetical protein
MTNPWLGWRLRSQIPLEWFFDKLGERESGRFLEPAGNSP